MNLTKYLPATNIHHLQASETEQLPPPQLGLRRLLFAVHVNSSANMIAAPMAHYIAKNSSRFLYSHGSCFLPVHGMDKILKQESVIMRFHIIDGIKVAVHQAMHYWFRPKEMENLCMYEYYRDVEFVTKSSVGISKEEHFEFTEEHPLSQHTVVVYRTKLAVPVFPWNWLGSTKSFQSPMYIISEKEDHNFKAKETYAYQFMMLFLPFRIIDDLIHEGCYQAKWKQSNDLRLFTPDMISVAENIQAIYNSLESQMPPNALVEESDLIDIDDSAAGKTSEAESNQIMLECMADYFATTSDAALTEDATSIDRLFPGRLLKHSVNLVNDSLPSEILNSVIEMDAMEIIKKPTQDVAPEQGRFQTDVFALNSLSVDSLLRGVETTQAKKAVNATGTWQSITLWGVNAGLDAEQQCAFEILASVYVLTFYNEVKSGEQDDEFLDRKKKLCKLARKDETTNDPLRMFVTGPAGAGKCKN
jgi:hypothetical protein